MGRRCRADELVFQLGGSGIVLNVGLAAGILDETVFSMFVVMAVILTIITTPLTLWVYPSKYRTRTIPTGPPGASRSKEGEAVVGQQTSRFLVILSRMEHLSTAMLFTQLFAIGGSSTRAPVRLPAIEEKSQGKDVDSGSEAGVFDETHGQDPPVSQRWDAHRLIELTGRTHSVMQSIESDSQARKDDLLQLYRSFAGLRGVNVSTGLDVVEQESFSEIVTQRAAAVGAELVVVPWTVPESGASAAVMDERRDTPNPTAGSSSRPTSPRISTMDHIFNHGESGLYTYFLRRVFADCPKDIAVLVDRGFSAVQHVSNGNGGQHLFLPFFGGADDRLALSLCVQLCQQPNISATVIRISDNPDVGIAEPVKVTTKDSVSSASMEESVRAHQTALDANNLTLRVSSVCPCIAKPDARSHFPFSFQVKRLPHRSNESSAADEQAWDHYTLADSDRSNPLREALSRITFTTISTTQPLQTLVDNAVSTIERTARTSWRPLLVLAGRGRVDGADSAHGQELAKLLTTHGQLPDVGAEIRKTLGDVATALAVSSSASVMVVQAGCEVTHEMA
jgi:hypothetical protein